MMTVVNENDFHPDFFAEVPQSKGMPPFLPILIAIFIVGIFAIGGSVVLLAGHGHVWPSQQSTRIDLAKPGP
ncbi:MAG: hypothetical protein ACYDGM_00065 [Vulcanimicrobiaceae bacterium]